MFYVSALFRSFVKFISWSLNNFRVKWFKNDLHAQIERTHVQRTFSLSIAQWKLAHNIRFVFFLAIIEFVDAYYSVVPNNNMKENENEKKWRYKKNQHFVLFPSIY